MLVMAVVVVFDSCIDKVDFDAAEADSQLVVDGFISSAPGPYTVKLSRTRKVLDFSPLKTVSASRVAIYDNLGNFEELQEVYLGTYQTSPFGIRGVVGREYTLRVETRDGNVYESTPEKINPPGSIDDIYTSFEKYQSEIGLEEYRYRIFVNSSVDPSGGKNFRWKFTGTYQVETNPELRVVRVDGNFVSSPPACANPCSCCICWVDLSKSLPQLSDSIVNKNDQIKNVEVGSVPIDAWTFLEKVQIKVEQFSLTPNAHTYWKNVTDQKLGSTSLFQPSLGKIASNIKVKVGAGEVNGLFSAFSSTEKIIFLSRSDLPENVRASLGAPPVIGESCLDAFPNSTNVKPATW